MATKPLADKATPKPRDFSFDNLRCILIATVVFVHLLEGAPAFPGSKLIYQLLCCFSMPAFIFITGYYAKYSPKKLVFQWILPYFGFQTIYLLYARYILDTDTTLQYSTPYWLLWFMMACVFYLLLLPVYQVRSKKLQFIILAISVALALLAGFDKTIGYHMSLSRFFVFQPWFILGYYYRNSFEPSLTPFLEKRKWLIGGFSLILAAGAVVLLDKMNATNFLFYGSIPYENLKQGIGMRAATILINLAWVAFLLFGLRPLLNKKIPLITTIGQNTLPIYLLHGFIVRVLPIHFPALLSSPFLILLTCALILLLLGNVVFKTVVYIFGLNWLERCLPFITRKKESK